MSKGFVTGFLAGLSLLGIIGVGASLTKQKDLEQQKYQAEIVDATSAQVGVMTEKQRFHSRLHNGLGASEGGKTISQLIQTYKGQKVVLGRYLNGRMWLPSDKPEAPEDYFGSFAQESDAIIRGKAVNKASQITEDDSFLFTDYEIVVAEVFKNSTRPLLNAGTTITVTSPGGKIVLDDVVVKAGGNGEAAFPVNAQEVLLFLKYIPETEGFRLTRYNGGFELNGKFVRPLAGIFPITPSFFANQHSFLKTIRAISNN